MAFGDELPLLDRQWLTRLTNAHNYEVPELWRLLNYYEGQQPLSYMHPELLATLDDRVRQLVINWPRQVVDALEERIDLDGFRLGGQSAIDEDLDHIWRYNDLDAGYQQAHVTSKVGKRACVIVGANPNPADADFPIITVESPLKVHAELDPATRRVVAARKAVALGFDEDDFTRAGQPGQPVADHRRQDLVHHQEQAGRRVEVGQFPKPTCATSMRRSGRSR